MATMPALLRSGGIALDHFICLEQREAVGNTSRTAECSRMEPLRRLEARGTELPMFWFHLSVHHLYGL